jgi:hypothetical protein
VVWAYATTCPPATSEPNEMKTSPNQSVQPTGGSRFAQPAFERQRRLPPVADACRWAAQHLQYE